MSARVYNNASQIGLPNDSISSVMIDSRMKLTLYVHGSLTFARSPLLASLAFGAILNQVTGTVQLTGDSVIEHRQQFRDRHCPRNDGQIPA